MLLESTDREILIIYLHKYLEVNQEPAPIDFHEAMRDYFDAESNVRLKLTQEAHCA